MVCLLSEFPEVPGKSTGMADFSQFWKGVPRSLNRLSIDQGTLFEYFFIQQSSVYP
jgi:hypothetical protein